MKQHGWIESNASHQSANAFLPFERDCLRKMGDNKKKMTPTTLSQMANCGSTYSETKILTTRSLGLATLRRTVQVREGRLRHEENDIILSYYLQTLTPEYGYGPNLTRSPPQPCSFSKKAYNLGHKLKYIEHCNYKMKTGQWCQWLWCRHRRWKDKHNSAIKPMTKVAAASKGYRRFSCTRVKRQLPCARRKRGSAFVTRNMECEIWMNP